MITRLEADGFKNLMSLGVDFGPFTCIVGENGTGKSNVFDLVHFLSLLADRPMMDAAQEVRRAGDERSGDPRDLFWDGYSTSPHKISVAAEMIVPSEIEDDFGRPARPTVSFLRYELEIGYSPPSGLERVGRLSLLAERLTHINRTEATRHLRFPHSAREFRDNVLFGRRSGTAFISTSEVGGDTVISIHADGGSRGKPRAAAASRAPATVVSTVTGADDPTILAARREMQSWRLLALEPSALRSSDRYVDPTAMGADGRHLAAALYRIAAEAHAAGDGGAEKVYARIAGRLADLGELRVRDLSVVADDVRELLTVYLTDGAGLRLPARSLSEGTLRFLALCVLLEDTAALGVVCMEEPENGIHPANIASMVRLVEDLAVDPKYKPDANNQFRQVIINTHSPGIVQLVSPGSLLFASVTPRQTRNGYISRTLRLRPLARTWRAGTGTEAPVSKLDVLSYLTGPPGAQLETIAASASAC